MEFTSIESEYLVALLKCALKSQNVPDIPAGLNWKELVNISKKQQVYSTIAPIQYSARAGAGIDFLFSKRACAYDCNEK